MANYNLVINSQFKPFSYQEMLAPALMATQAHQALESQYGELATKANVFNGIANEQTDPYAYKMLKTYSDDLEKQADQLASEGLNAASRRNALNMQARFSSEVTPVEIAYKKREELAAEQRKIALSNPTMFFQRDAATMSLDDFIKNPSLTYGESYSGALLSQQVGQMAANLKTVLNGKGKLSGVGLPYQYEQLLQYGYTPQQIQQAIANPEKGNPVLTTLVEMAIDASGMKKWASPEQLSQARAYANQGLYNAIGKTDIKNFTDSFGMQDDLNARQQARQEAAARRAAAEQGQVGEIPNEKGIPIDIHNFNSNSYGKGPDSMGTLLYKIGVSTGGINGRRAISRPETYLSIFMNSVTTKKVKTKDGSGRIKWFTSNGLLMSRKSILSQVDPNDSRGYKEMGKKYDRIWRDIKKLGIRSSDNKHYSVRDIQRAVSENMQANSKNSNTLSAIGLRLSNPSKTFENKLMPLLETDDGEKLNIKEIKTFSKEGKLEYSKITVDKSDIMDTKKGTLKGTPYFFAPPSQNGILMRLNGKVYFIDSKNLGSIGQTSNSIDIPRLKKAVAARNEIIKQYGEDAYYSSEAGRDIESVIENSGQAYIKAYIQQLDSEVETPKSKITD